MVCGRAQRSSSPARRNLGYSQFFFGRTGCMMLLGNPVVEWDQDD